MLLVDNYDSFTFNLAAYLTLLGAEVVVRRNDAVTAGAAVGGRYTHVVISPGPGTPGAAGETMACVRAALARSVPLLGVCLGHQAIVEALGGRVMRAAAPVHGRAATITHDGAGVFRGLPAQLEVGRYHSLIAAEAPWPRDLIVSARAAREIMAVRHRTLPIQGVQFHPESVLTPMGAQMLANFLEVADMEAAARIARGAGVAGKSIGRADRQV
ncbi:aminodeoxychorismate/anthranilate synthase component II [soil metagenome]